MSVHVKVCGAQYSVSVIRSVRGAVQAAVRSPRRLEANWRLNLWSSGWWGVGEVSVRWALDTRGEVLVSSSTGAGPAHCTCDHTALLHAAQHHIHRHLLTVKSEFHTPFCTTWCLCFNTILDPKALKRRKTKYYFWSDCFNVNFCQLCSEFLGSCFKMIEDEKVLKCDPRHRARVHVTTAVSCTI